MEARRATSPAWRCSSWCGEKLGDVLSLLMPPRGGWELLWSKWPPWLHFPGSRRGPAGEGQVPTHHLLQIMGAPSALVWPSRPSAWEQQEVVILCKPVSVASPQHCQG